MLSFVLAACGPAPNPPAEPATEVPVVAPTASQAISAATATLTASAPTATATAPAVTENAATPTEAASQAAPTETIRAATPTADPAVDAIYAYLEARAAADVNAVTDLSCPAWQGQAVTEAISFRSMNAVLEDVTCQATGQSGPFTLVACTGQIVTSYGSETRVWDLSNFIYQAAPEDGAWKMCGYA